MTPEEFAERRALADAEDAALWTLDAAYEALAAAQTALRLHAETGEPEWLDACDKALKKVHDSFGNLYPIWTTPESLPQP